MLISCSSSEPLTEEESEEERSTSLTDLDISDEIIENYISDNLTELEQLLVQHRTELQDQYALTNREIPEEYQQEYIEDDSVVDIYAGFRVQILSTRDVMEADTVRDNFIVWADSTIAGFEPDAYVLFRPPNYRVRAGDFRNREQAIEFSRLLKNRYPDAWVVHDRISPDSVPPDTVNIRFKEIQPISVEVDTLKN